ncbi:MAG: DUF3443 family protein [Myxococcaceae bacterium]
MKYINLIFLGSYLFLSACGSKDDGGSKTPPGSDSICPGNALHVTVNGSRCGTTQYVNQPCVSVTVNGQVINNILLDTGSFGLRVFKSVLKTSLTQAKADDGKDLAECVQFGDGSSQWGPVMMASVQLGGEKAVNVPIMVVDSTYPGDPGCSTSKNQPSDVGPEDASFNGILGVGLFAQDCGLGCTAAASKSSGSSYSPYYSCDGIGKCSQTTVALANQVQHPGALLAQNNNGVILSLPAVPDTGAASVEGCLYFGIGTQSNNALGSAKTYLADRQGRVTTLFNGHSMTSFLDSGSNGLYFPGDSAPPELTVCKTNGFYCPSRTQRLTASINGVDINFSIANISTLSGLVFNNIGAPTISGEAYFDWGLPFFFGKNIAVGMGKEGSGPYWAY